nr:transient receptor potential cation channel [Hymenolepis microstoma]
MRIACLEEDGKVISRSQSKDFDTFRMSRVADAEPAKLPSKQFTYDNHKVLYFINPQDDITPHSLSRFIPWTEEFPNYEPKILDDPEGFTPDWTTEEVEEGNTKGRKSIVALKNPTGRTGTFGRGLLPSFGPNSAVVVVLILEENSFKNELVSTKEVLRRILLRNCPRRKHQLPWFIYKHTAFCDKLECLHSLFLSYMYSVAGEASKLDSNQSLIYRLIVEEFNKFPIRLCHLGELEDWVNCDNAWLDITAICVRITSNFRFWDIIPLLFSTTSSKADWFEVSKMPPVKSSHFSCLAYFLETYLRNQSQIGDEKRYSSENFSNT